ncbi:MAG: hypothetical protein RLZZ385_1622 [Pseudomonadota bacterium]|jgi:UDP-2-acetamido-2,6-beta-L-arabino-hexul-4-ose reductase
MSIPIPDLNVLVTGAHGFIGKNLTVRLRERTDIRLQTVGRGETEGQMLEAATGSDVIIHLAGVNRPQDPEDFNAVNAALTERLLNHLSIHNPKARLILTSSIQVDRDNDYGRSKLAAEKSTAEFVNRTGSTAFIYRLPNVFGKWCKPNYNSVVATFCHNISQGLPIRIDDPATSLNLVYIDDVIDDMMGALGSTDVGVQYREVRPVYTITLGQLAEQVLAFPASRESLVTEAVGVGLTRALYATYISYLAPEQFAYELPSHNDGRGEFVEFLKTRDSGQFSYFTARPGVTRGGHYHHTKTEKFLVIKGRARFGFRHMVTGESCSLETRENHPQVVETIPGWTHDITNIGDDDLVVLLWANELFDRSRPDTISCKV